MTKLFSTAAALDTLGADYCFQTPIYRRGDVDASGVLKGDLILRSEANDEHLCGLSVFGSSRGELNRCVESINSSPFNPKPYVRAASSNP